jgi:hypothetical protein
MVNNSHQYQQREQTPLNSDGQYDHHCLETIVRFVNISGIIDHHCLEMIVHFVDIGVNY